MSAVKSKSKINSVHNRLYNNKTPMMPKSNKKGMSRKSSIEGLFLPKIYSGNETDGAKPLGLGGAKNR